MTLNRTVTLGILLLVACGRPEEARVEPAAKQSPLQASFERAAREFQVPASVLESIAYIETRASTQAGLVSQAGAHGIMAIVGRGDWNMLARATALTGATAGRLDVDFDANIRGAAAVLRELGDKSFRENPSLDSNDLGAWYHAVSLYPGFESATQAQDYAAEVFVRMERGYELPELTLPPTASNWRTNAPATAARRDALGGSDYPAAARFTASPNHYSNRTSYEFVVIHTMQGSYSGTISWFQNPASQVSANYCVRSSDGEITQMVHDNQGAWHAQCYNMRSIGIEHEGFIAAPGTWYTDAMYTESAKLTRWLSDRYSIPRDRSHIIGHVDIPTVCNTDHHTDPGTGWNWTKYMALVNGTTPTGTTGVFTGVIYTGGNTANRVSGAVVTVSGHTVTTGADGLYTFNLAPGSYNATVTKSGFTTSTVTRTVTAGATIWGSMNINPSTAANGTLSGKVYAFNATNPADTSVAIAGVVVKVTPGTATVTTAADGNWSFSLAPGTYTVTATKTGYATASQTRTVASGATVNGNIGLTATTAPDQQPPTVVINSPQNNAQLDLAMIDVSGTASDDRGPVASVKVSLNGGATTDVPVTSGAFTVQVKLKPGMNTIQVSATDAANNTGHDDATATFNAGLSGTVLTDGDTPAPIAGASLELFDAAGMSASKVTSAADGKYLLPVTNVPADYKLVVKATGYITHSETVTIADDQQVSEDINLTAGVDEGTGGPSITFTEPEEGATVNTESVTVYGMVGGFELASIVVNGIQGETLGDGGFSVTVPLTEGPNTLIAEVTGSGGETLTGTLHVNRKLMTGMLPDDKKAKGGCSAGGGLELFALLTLVGTLRRRRNS
jgi:hypothetical protein